MRAYEVVGRSRSVRLGVQTCRFLPAAPCRSGCRPSARSPARRCARADL